MGICRVLPLGFLAAGMALITAGNAAAQSVAMKPVAETVFTTQKVAVDFPRFHAGSSDFSLVPKWQRILADEPRFLAQSPMLDKREPHKAGTTHTAAARHGRSDEKSTGATAKRNETDRLGPQPRITLPLPAALGTSLPGAADAPSPNKVTECKSDDTDCLLKEWAAIITETADDETSLQLDRVNRWVNRTPYRDDTETWATADFWQTPDEFFSRGGDCEDYAITKYYTLASLGFDPADMRILVLYDEGLRLHHAVLLVRHDGQILVLDNQRDAILTLAELPQYRPIYSVNEQGWWMHRALAPVRLTATKPVALKTARVETSPHHQRAPRVMRRRF